MATKNFDTILKNVDGSNIMENADTAVMVKTILVNSCMMTFQNEQIEGEEKARRFALGMRLYAGGEQEISPEEIVLLKKLVGYGYPPLIVGQVYEFLNK